ncbi:hypothetical protein C6H68_10000 [Photorhabdus luminescens]|nr:hypothetical protein C6H68_10000 [Photorhabdus luminescens]
MRNPFKRLQIYSRNLKLELITKGFIHKIPEELTVRKYNHYIMQSMKCSRLPRKVMKLISSYEIELFNKGIIWLQWKSM